MTSSIHIWIQSTESHMTNDAFTLLNASNGAPEIHCKIFTCIHKCTSILLYFLNALTRSCVVEVGMTCHDFPDFLSFENSVLKFQFERCS